VGSARPGEIAGRVDPLRGGDIVTHKTARANLRNSTQWRKSSYSFPDGQECVKITTELTEWVGVRDSKLGDDSPVLAFTAAQWRAMLSKARTGQLDI
jgi:hypothetical protein